jgi:hypothetical protein
VQNLHIGPLQPDAGRMGKELGAIVSANAAQRPALTSFAPPPREVAPEPRPGAGVPA